MKVFDLFYAIVLGALLLGLVSCGNDDNKDPMIEINVTSSDCEFTPIFFACLDSNLFVVTILSTLSGPEGTFVGIFASGETPESIIVDCGDWSKSNKNFPLPGCSREPGDQEVGSFNVTAEMPCLSPTEVYENLPFTLAGFLPGEPNLSLPFSSVSADVFVNCGL